MWSNLQNCQKIFFSHYEESLLLKIVLDFEVEFMYNLTHLWANFCFDLVIIVIYLVQFKVDTFFLHTKFMIGSRLIVCNKNLQRISVLHYVFHDTIFCSIYSIHKNCSGIVTMRQFFFYFKNEIVFQKIFAYTKHQKTFSSPFLRSLLNIGK